MPWTPTRLLDVGTLEDIHIRLVMTKEPTSQYQRYATLSHCWGQSSGIIVTTQRTLLQHEKGIPILNLPKTFRDSIRITRSLGLRYLWVDSLCIVQDSAEDWSVEADIMSEVYRYAYINIAATGAEDGSHGCFWERKPETVRPTELVLNGAIVKRRKPKDTRVSPNLVSGLKNSSINP